MTDPDRAYAPPTLLTALHEIVGFRSGEPSLDDWLRERALANMAVGATRTYVITPSGSYRVVGYYALCMGHILSQEVTGSMRRNMPRYIPAVVLGRLAIDTDWQGKGLGRSLLHDAVMRSLRASREVSARLLVVHAISPEAEAFYRRYGFTRLPVETPTLALDLVKLGVIADGP